MFKILFIILVALVAAQRDDCMLFCTCEGAIATCRNPPTFPEFITTGWLETLILIDGTLTTLPLSEDRFPRLRQLVLRNCRLIPCSVINNLRSTWTNIILVSDSCTEATTLGVTFSTDIYLISTTSGSEANAATRSDLVTDTTRITIHSGEGTPFSSNFESSNNEQRDENELAIILGTSITLIVIIGGAAIGLVAYCVYKKFRNRVSQFTIDDEFLGMRSGSIVNPSYEHHSSC